MLMMNSDGTVKSSQKIASDTGGGPTLANGDRFGRSVSSLGDFDGDGVSDLAVGAYGDKTGGTNRGAVHVLLLNSDGTVKNSRKIASNTGGAPGLADGDGFGISVSSLGDLDRNGVTDLAVGAPGAADTNTPGTVHVLFMQPAFPPPANLDITRVAQTGVANAINTNFDGASERDVEFSNLEFPPQPSWTIDADGAGPLAMASQSASLASDPFLLEVTNATEASPGGGEADSNAMFEFNFTLSAAFAFDFSGSTVGDGGAVELMGTTSGVIEFGMGTLQPDDYSLTATATSTVVGGSLTDMDSSQFSLRLTTIDDGAAVVGRNTFYGDSFFDANDSPTAAAASVAAGGAIATDKTALLPGETATFSNYTSYSRGINGLMVDIADMASEPTLETIDSFFEFTVGNDGTPGDWDAGPDPVEITVRPGGGNDGSDRITILWADNAIENTWLETIVLANASTGLAEPDVFYFGNAIGESGNSAADTQVNAQDIGGARDNPHNFLNRAAIDDAYDYNRDSLVNAQDIGIARDNPTNFLTDLNLISPPAAAPGIGVAVVPIPLEDLAESASGSANKTPLLSNNAAPVITRQSWPAYAVYAVLNEMGSERPGHEARVLEWSRVDDELLGALAEQRHAPWSSETEPD